MAKFPVEIQIIFTAPSRLFMAGSHSIEVEASMLTRLCAIVLVVLAGG